MHIFYINHIIKQVLDETLKILVFFLLKEFFLFEGS